MNEVDNLLPEPDDFQFALLCMEACETEAELEGLGARLKTEMKSNTFTYRQIGELRIAYKKRLVDLRNAEVWCKNARW